ncbi:MAG: hypothetical protein OEW04_06260 [Nitrospirota bacterium]|nr:hypothetical protein [Nitrospirota bacterium]
MIKYMLARGMHYTSIGARDYARWSQIMIDEFGAGIKPSIRHICKWSPMLPGIMNSNREAKINCWEFMGCGLQMKEDLKGSDWGALCPAFTDENLKGLHGGQMRGRACGLVARTHCGGTRQETSRQKHALCSSCDFRALVIDEENGNKITLLS